MLNKIVFKVSLIILTTLFSVGCSRNSEPASKLPLGSASLQIEQEGYQRMVLGREIHRYAASDFRDLRIETAEGIPVPWFHEPSKMFSEQEQMELYPFRLIDKKLIQSEKGELKRIIFDFQLPIDSESNEPLEYDSLNFQVAESEFSVQAELFGRFTGSQWTYIGTDSLYRLGPYRKLQAQPGRSLNYPFLRIILKDSTQLPEITDLKTVRTISGRDLVNEVRIPLEWKDVEKGELKNSIRISNKERLKVYELSLGINGNFHRKYRLTDSTGRLLTRGTLYRFDFNGESREQLTIRMPDLKSSRKIDEFFLEIENGDNAPLQLTRCEALCFFDRIVLGPRSPGLLTVTWGDDELSKPDYDIRHFASSLELHNLPEPELTDIILSEPVESVSAELNRKLLQALFMVVILLVVGAVGAVTLVQLKRGTE